MTPKFGPGGSFLAIQRVCSLNNTALQSLFLLWFSFHCTQGHMTTITMTTHTHWVWVEKRKQSKAPKKRTTLLLLLLFPHIINRKTLPPLLPFPISHFPFNIYIYYTPFHIQLTPLSLYDYIPFLLPTIHLISLPSSHWFYTVYLYIYTILIKEILTFPPSIYIYIYMCVCVNLLPSWCTWNSILNILLIRWQEHC